MESVVQAAAVYVILLVLIRLTGKRSLSQTTMFDFVLLLIVSEAIQQALITTDNAMVNALLPIVTLLGLDIGRSLLKQRSPALDRWFDDGPLVLVEDGKPLEERRQKARVDESDKLTPARELRGLERMEQIKYAVLERSGGISIVPKEAR